MSSSLPKSRTVLGLALVLIFVQVSGVASHADIHKERTHDGAISPNQEDDDHSAFEHNVILGSKKEAEQFDDLSPEEAKVRLASLAKRMDANHDGSVDKDELKKWILKSFASLTMEEAAERFEDADLNGDKLVTWEEHMSESFGDGNMTFNTKKEEDEHIAVVDEERQLFYEADKNGDMVLTLEEYARLAQPQDFPEMHKLYVTQALRKRDSNRDGKVSMEEFLSEDKVPKEYLLEERERFQYDLDRNKDSVLDLEEIHQWVIPNNDDIADQEVEHLLEKADDNRDGKLSISEIVDHHEAFVSSEATDFGEHLVKYKDEL